MSGERRHALAAGAVVLLLLGVPGVVPALNTSPSTPFMAIELDLRQDAGNFETGSIDIDVTNTGPGDVILTSVKADKVPRGVDIQCTKRCSSSITDGDTVTITVKVNVTRNAETGLYENIPITIKADDGSSKVVLLTLEIDVLRPGAVRLTPLEMAPLSFSCGSNRDAFSQDYTMTLENLGDGPVTDLDVRVSSKDLEVSIKDVPADLAAFGTTRPTFTATADRDIGLADALVTFRIAYTNTIGPQQRELTRRIPLDIPVVLDIDVQAGDGITATRLAASTNPRWDVNYGQIEFLKRTSLTFTVEETCGFQDTQINSRSLDFSTGIIRATDYASVRPAVPHELPAGGSETLHLDVLFTPGIGGVVCNIEPWEQLFSAVPPIGQPAQWSFAVKAQPKTRDTDASLDTARAALSTGDSISQQGTPPLKVLADAFNQRLGAGDECRAGLEETLGLGAAIPIIAFAFDNLRHTQPALDGGRLPDAADGILLGLRAARSLETDCGNLAVVEWRRACTTLAALARDAYETAAQDLVAAAARIGDSGRTAFEVQRTHSRLALVYAMLGDAASAASEDAKAQASYERVRAFAETALAELQAQQALEDDYDGKWFFKTGDRYVVWGPFLRGKLDDFRDRSIAHFEAAAAAYREAGDERSAAIAEGQADTLSAAIDDSQTAYWIVAAVWFAAAAAILIAWIYHIIMFFRDRTRLSLGDPLLRSQRP